MSSPDLQWRRPALTTSRIPSIRTMYLTSADLVQEWVITLREQVAAVQGHPCTERALTNWKVLVGSAAVFVLVGVLTLLGWAQGAEVAGDLMLANLIRLVVVFAMLTGSSLAVLLAVARLTGVLRFRHS